MNKFSKQIRGLLAEYERLKSYHPPDSQNQLLNAMLTEILKIEENCHYIPNYMPGASFYIRFRCFEDNDGKIPNYQKLDILAKEICRDLCNVG